jgi:hypothetical protein
MEGPGGAEQAARASSKVGLRISRIAHEDEAAFAHRWDTMAEEGT